MAKIYNKNGNLTTLAGWSSSVVVGVSSGVGRRIPSGIGGNISSGFSSARTSS